MYLCDFAPGLGSEWESGGAPGGRRSGIGGHEARLEVWRCLCA